MGSGARRDRAAVTGGPVVCDASPLIALAQIARLELLVQLYGHVVIPPAVAREIGRTVPRLPPWVVESPLTRPIDVLIAKAELGAGETASLSLALEVSAYRVVLDDRKGRHLARSLGITVVGTLGLLLLAKRQGLLASIRPEVEALGTVQFHLAPALVARALIDADEGSPSNPTR